MASRLEAAPAHDAAVFKQLLRGIRYKRDAPMVSATIASRTEPSSQMVAIGPAGT
jgi:hypothetical protein